MACPCAHSQFNGGIPPKWDHSDAKGCQHNPHSDVWHLWRIGLSTLEFKTSIVSSEESNEANDHFTQRWVDIEVELAFEVMGAELAKVRFVPYDDVGGTNVVKTSPAGEESVDDGWNVFEILEEEFALKKKTVNEEQDMQLRERTMEVAGGGGGWGMRPLATYARAFLLALA
jgi:hypothetical protein